MFTRRFVAAVLVATSLALFGAACSDDDGDDGSDGSTPAAGTTQSAASPSAGTPASDKAYTAADAQAIIDASAVAVADLPDDGWAGCKTSRGPTVCILADTTTDNATAAESDPDIAALVERCGRLLGRTVALQVHPDEQTSRYTAGETVAVFANLTVYATEAGAVDCAAEAAARTASVGELARQFAKVFVDPEAVVVTAVDYPTVADGSFAATLEGQILFAGVPVDLTVLVVGFRQGNVNAAVGAAGKAAPAAAELTPLVDLVIERIAAAQ